MKCAGGDRYVLEEGEPVTQTCRLCYPEQGAQARRDEHTFFYCPLCGRFYVCGRYVDEFSRSAFEEFVSKRLEHTEVKMSIFDKIDEEDMIREAIQIAYERFGFPAGRAQGPDQIWAIAKHMVGLGFQFEIAADPTVTAGKPTMSVRAKFFRLGVGDCEGFGPTFEGATLAALETLFYKMEQKGKES